MTQGLDRKTQSIIGLVFLVGMVVTFIVAIGTFDGTPTLLLIVLAIVFLVVAIFFLQGAGVSRGAGGVGEGQSQQQSVVLGGDGRTVTQSFRQSSGVFVVCRSCSDRVPEGAQFCPACGASMG